MGFIYPGTCANKVQPNTQPGRQYAIRVRTQKDIINFIDVHYGEHTCHLDKESGDYVIFRANGLPSYILAVSVDDLFEGYSEIVRGSDLLAITARQVHLSLLLKNRHANFFHIPIITDQHGDKLSKQTHAPSLNKYHARSQLFFALKDLGQEPPRQLVWRSLGYIWQWAMTHWQPKQIPLQHAIQYNH